MSLWKAHYGSVVFVCLGIVTIPQLFFQANSAEFGGDLLLVALPVLSAVAVFLLLLVPGKLITSPKVQCALAGLGLSIVLADTLFRAPLGALDGAAPDFTTSTTHSVGSLALFLGIPLLSVLLSTRLTPLYKDLASVVALLALGLIGYSTVLALQTPDDTDATAVNTAPHSEATPKARQPNVYLLWLDALETGYLRNYLDAPGNNAAFSGFTSFENNNSNYLYTLQSYASFMSGTVYRQGEYGEWFANSDRLRNALKNSAYRITTYAKKDFLSDLDDHQVEAATLFASRNKAQHPFVADFVTYWITRSFPAAWVEAAFTAGTATGTWAHSIINPNQRYGSVQTISDGIEPLSGVFTLEQLLADEADRSDHNELVIAQAVIPHGPYVIDRRCEYRGKSEAPPPEKYAEQLECAMSHTAAFIAELKRLGRFETSIIVIMGDHGSGWAGLINSNDSPGAEPLDATYTPWTRAMVAGRAAAGLMIKPARSNDKSALARYQNDSQLIDIYPTVLTLLGLQDQLAEDVEGQSLFNSQGQAVPTAARAKFITYFRPSKTLNLLEADIYDLAQTTSGEFDVTLRGPFRSEAEMPALTCGSAISFGRAFPDAEYYRSNGLSGIEAWGRWSMSATADITFKTPAIPCSKNTLSLAARGFVLAAHPVQSAQLTLNGSPIGSIRFQHAAANQRIHTFTLPSGVLLDNAINRLEFRFDSPQSPKAIGLSTDSRLLGLGLESVQLD